MTRSASIHLDTVVLNNKTFTQVLNASIHLALSYLLLIHCILSGYGPCATVTSKQKITQQAHLQLLLASLPKVSLCYYYR
jgi:hypothetical protein